MLSSAERHYEVCQKRWRIKEYHKSIKQNASLTKSPISVIIFMILLLPTASWNY